jgi:hypothetical protein
VEWEYCIEEIVFGQSIAILEEQLNELGRAGWKVIGAWPKAKPDPKGDVYILFKKAKSK